MSVRKVAQRRCWPVYWSEGEMAACSYLVTRTTRDTTWTVVGDGVTSGSRASARCLLPAPGPQSFLKDFGMSYMIGDTDGHRAEARKPPV